MAKGYLDKVPVLGALNNALAGAPDRTITMALFGVAIVAIVMALFAPPVLKATVLAWIVFP